MRRGRKPPANVPDPVWYFAYGSNMNEKLFRERRHMTPIDTRTGTLSGYRLVFTKIGGAKPGISAPANIVQDSGEVVHGVLYLSPRRKFARLDNSGGKQYTCLWTEVEDHTGNRLPVFTYRVADPDATEGIPGKQYMNLIRTAARERGLPQTYIEFLDRMEARQ